MFFRFPPDARWNPQRSVVEFGIGVGEYEGVVRVSRRVFQNLISQPPTPERCLECGWCGQMLRRHIAGHGLSVEQYRARWGL